MNSPTEVVDRDGWRGVGLTDLHASTGYVQVMKTSDTYLRFMVFNQGTSIYV